MCILDYINLELQIIVFSKHTNPTIINFQLISYDFFFSGLKMAIKWMSPEVLLCNKYSTKGDVWTFGIVLVEILTYGKEPYEGESLQLFS